MSCRTDAPFSPHVWHEIDCAVQAVRAANCTARRFLEVDGPHGMGLTNVGGAEQWLEPMRLGADFTRWNVTRPDRRIDVPYGEDTPKIVDRQTGDDLSGVHGGTFLARGMARPVPLIASPFSLGMRAIAAYDARCQPLDVCAAAAAARDVALEEERLLYYGYDMDPDPQFLLQTVPLPEWDSYIPVDSSDPPRNINLTPIDPTSVFSGLHNAIQALAERGYAGPFALTVSPDIYRRLHTPITHVGRTGVTVLVPVVELFRNLFRGGIYLAPVIDPTRDDVQRVGAVVTLGRAYARLVVGQDWHVAYRGSNGVQHSFLILSSLQLRICDLRSIQVLRLPEPGKYPPSAEPEGQYISRGQSMRGPGAREASAEPEAE
jgi:uncharacterized linocin/CFP29 family protein